jgi:hypothetical protein
MGRVEGGERGRVGTVSRACRAMSSLTSARYTRPRDSEKASSAPSIVNPGGTISRQSVSRSSTLHYAMREEYQQIVLLRLEAHTALGLLHRSSSRVILARVKGVRVCCSVRVQLAPVSIQRLHGVLSSHPSFLRPLGRQCKARSIATLKHRRGHTGGLRLTTSIASRGYRRSGFLLR